MRGEAPCLPFCICTKACSTFRKDLLRAALRFLSELPGKASRGVQTSKVPRAKSLLREARIVRKCCVRQIGSGWAASPGRRTGCWRARVPETSFCRKSHNCCVINKNCLDARNYYASLQTRKSKAIEPIFERQPSETPALSKPEPGGKPRWKRCLAPAAHRESQTGEEIRPSGYD